MLNFKLKKIGFLTKTQGLEPIPTSLTMKSVPNGNVNVQ